MSVPLKKNCSRLTVWMSVWMCIQWRSYLSLLFSIWDPIQTKILKTYYRLTTSLWLVAATWDLCRWVSNADQNAILISGSIQSHIAFTPLNSLRYKFMSNLQFPIPTINCLACCLPFERLKMRELWCIRLLNTWSLTEFKLSSHEKSHLVASARSVCSTSWIRLQISTQTSTQISTRVTSQGLYTWADR